MTRRTHEARDILDKVVALTADTGTIPGSTASGACSAIQELIGEGRNDRRRGMIGDFMMIGEFGRWATSKMIGDAGMMQRLENELMLPRDGILNTRRIEKQEEGGADPVLGRRT